MRAILTLLLFTLAARAWDPPIGIPEPDWGGTTGNPIELARPAFPSPWTSNTAGFYFVTPGGGNAGNGYPGSPRSSIPSNPGAGSVIVVDGSFGAVTMDLRGNSSGIVWLTSYDTEDPAVFTGKITIPNTATYFILDSINTDFLGSGNGKIEVSAGTDYGCFRNIDLKGVAPVNGSSTSADSSENQGGLLFYESSGNLTTHIIVYGCNIHDTGNKNYSSGDPDGHCISLQQYAEDIWIVDNEISWTSGNGLQVGAGTTGSTADAAACERVYAGRNVVHDCAQAAIWSKRSEGMIVSQNVCYDMRRDTPSSPNPSGIGCQYGPRNYWVIFNTVYNCQCGVQINSPSLGGGATGTPTYVIGNVFYDIHDEDGSTDSWRTNLFSQGGVCMSSWSSQGASFVGNTCYDFDVGIEVAAAGVLTTAYANIFYNRTDSGGDIIVEDDSGGSNVVSYNLFGTGEIYVRMASGTIHTTLAGLNASKGATNIEDDPEFTNAGSANFTLAATSPCIGAAGSSAHALYGTFQTDFGRSIAFDRAGTARPQNTTWDIGAYEYTSGGGGGGTGSATATTVNAATLQVGQ